jgi:large subunit ribosomal protein L23
MARYTLVKPLISEKSEQISEKLGQYSFIVDKKANKIEIRKAVETMYNVNVEAVNTAVIPGKNKTRYTKSGLLRGTKSSYKKAIITLADGETIDFFGEA